MYPVSNNQFGLNYETVGMNVIRMLSIVLPTQENHTTIIVQYNMSPPQF